MKINCIGCGHNFELDEAYEDYSGQIKCWVCAATLDIQTADGRPKSVKLALPHIDEDGVTDGVNASRERLSYA